MIPTIQPQNVGANAVNALAAGQKYAQNQQMQRRQVTAADLQNFKASLPIMAGLAKGVKDQESYDAFKAKGQELGYVPPGMLPDVYNKDTKDIMGRIYKNYDKLIKTMKIGVKGKSGQDLEQTIGVYESGNMLKMGDPTNKFAPKKGSGGGFGGDLKASDINAARQQVAALFPNNAIYNPTTGEIRFMDKTGKTQKQAQAILTEAERLMMQGTPWSAAVTEAARKGGFPDIADLSAPMNNALAAPAGGGIPSLGRGGGMPPPAGGVPQAAGRNRVYDPRTGKFS